jgi:hypothetical protein
MIDLIFRVVQAIINKENNGYVSPSEFNRIAKLVQDEIFEMYFDNENRDKNRKNRGLTNKGYGNLDSNQRQKITQLAEMALLTKVAGKFNLPTDWYFIEDKGIFSDPAGKVVEECEKSNLGYLRNSKGKPSETFPIYEQFKNYLVVYPSTIENIEIRYIRTPKNPNWTYVVVAGKEQFDASNGDYQDFELHVSEFNNLVIRILSYFSINLREEEVTRIAESLKDKKTSNENN